MIVLDASAALEWLVQSSVGSAIEKRTVWRTEEIHVPHLLDVEVAQVLRRHTFKRIISAERAEQALSDLQTLPLNRHSHLVLLRRIWELRNSFTAYDAAYVAMAEAFDAPLITCDRKLAGATGHRARIEVF